MKFGRGVKTNDSTGWHTKWPYMEKGRKGLKMVLSRLLRQSC